MGEPNSQAHKHRAIYDWLVANGEFNPSEPRYWETETSVGGRTAPLTVYRSQDTGRYVKYTVTAGTRLLQGACRDMLGRAANSAAATADGVFILKVVRP